MFSNYCSKSIRLCGTCLILYRTTVLVTSLRKKPSKTLLEKEKILSPFAMFSTLPKANACNLGRITSLSVNAMNLDWSKILLCGKELTLSQVTNFRLLFLKGLQTTISSLMKMAELSKSLENTWRERRNCSSRAISHFPTVF